MTLASIAFHSASFALAAYYPFCIFCGDPSSFSFAYTPTYTEVLLCKVVVELNYRFVNNVDG